jgi:hypothetical protein
MLIFSPFFYHFILSRNGEKTDSSTNVFGKSGYLSAENRNYIYAYDPVLLSTQSGLQTLISDMKL